MKFDGIYDYIINEVFKLQMFESNFGFFIFFLKISFLIIKN